MQSAKLTLSALLLFAAWCLTAPGPAVAHHSHASLNDEDVRLFQGIVTKYSWRAPHVYIRVNVFKENGAVQEYLIEALNPPAMAALGWSRESFREGDLITWEGAHDLDPDRGYAGINWADTPDGNRLYAGATDYRKAQRAQATVLAAAVVEPVREIGSGNWARMAADGGTFPAIRQPATDWPLTDSVAAALADWSEDDNPINNCTYGGPPRSILSLSNFQWSRPDDRTIVIDRDMWTEARVIHLDADAKKGPPSGYGHSIGHFVGKELIVETDNFVDEVWGMYTGIDSTAQKTLTERYWLSDDGMRLNVEFTVTDPGVLREPHTMTHQWKRVPDRPLVKAECSVETAWLYKTAGYTEAQSGVSAEVTAAIEAETGVRAAPAIQRETAGGERGSSLWLILATLGAALLGLVVWRSMKR